MDQLMELKQKYNKALKRNKKAEKYLKDHAIEECEKEIEIKGIGTGKTTFDLFNEVVRELSQLIKEIEARTYRKLTQQEILNGFEV